MRNTTSRLTTNIRFKNSLLFIDRTPLVLRLLLRRTRREPSIIVLNRLAITIRSIAIAKRAWAIVAEFRLEPSRQFNLQLTQRVDHFALEQRKLRRIGKRVRVDTAQLLDCAIEVFCEIGVAP